MADWTNEQVLEWLTREGFGRFRQNFKGEQELIMPSIDAVNAYFSSRLEYHGC